MPGLASMALGATPIIGGVLLGAAAGQLKVPDVRDTIKQDLDLLDRIPPEQRERRAALQRSIDARIDDLVDSVDRSRALRAAAGAYEGSWRDIVLFVCAVLFTYVWWHVDHHRHDWLPMFLVMVLVSVVAAGYALRGTSRSVAGLFLRRK